GIGLDTAIHGLLGTWDMIWRPGPFIAADILLAVAVQFWLISNIYHGLKEAKPADGRKTVFYTLTIFIPFIFLQLFKFQNIASHNAISGFSSIISITIVLISNIAAITFLYLYRFKKAKLPLTIIAAIALILSFWPDMSGYLYTLQMIFGNISSFWLVLVILDKATGISENRNPWKNTFAMGISGILFFIFTFLYYGGYDMVLPFKSWMVPLSVSVILGIFSLLSVTTGSGLSPGDKNKGPEVRYLSKRFTPLYLMIILLIIPLILAAPQKNPDDPFKEELPVRIMTYNIHMGFNTKGYMDLEEIARVIEGNGADILALQEVSRGWVINGSIDTLEWLADRLDMQYIFMPASDAVWGNAVLSKYPLKLVKSGFLPRMNAPLRRSYLTVEVEIPDGRIINIICTHLHQIGDEGEIREIQVQELLKQWDGLERTAIMGDFNGEKGSNEIGMMYSAGLIDSQLESGREDELTYPHKEPLERIDYIWVTPDIEISDLKVPYSTASDHLPVVVNIE
ncbi:MAG: endonuclease/exonuclease/phosphatase family protein, partial [Actinomycetia bacterium]|nr:endonuclease/exonuclease/phosphatase family protein [Actinomycetes bacterium]